jgi:hypothetical protein
MKTQLHKNTLIGIIADGSPVVISASKELLSLLDGCFFEDNCFPETLAEYPQERGVYFCDIEVRFYSEDVDFVPIKTYKVDVTGAWRRMIK